MYFLICDKIKGVYLVLAYTKINGMCCGYCHLVYLFFTIASLETLFLHFQAQVFHWIARTDLAVRYSLDLVVLY